MPPETRVDENVQGGAPTFGPGPVDTAMENGAQTVFDEADPGVVLARKPLAEQVAEVSIARAREIIEQLETQDELDTANTIEATIKNRSAVRSAIAKRAGVLAGKVPPEEEKPPEEKPKRVRRDGPAVPLEPDVRRSHPDTIITDDGPAADGPVGPFPEVARSTVHSAEDAREVFRKVFESIQPAPDLPERTLISRTMREVAEAVRDIGAAGQPLSVRRIRVRETVGTLVVETEIDVEIGGGK